MKVRQFLISIFVELFKAAVAIFLVILLFLLGLKGCVYYHERPAHEFCEKVNDNDTVESIREKARKSGYLIFDKKSDQATYLIINTQENPYIRFECVISFNEGLIKSKIVRSSD